MELSVRLGVAKAADLNCEVTWAMSIARYMEADKGHKALCPLSEVHTMAGSSGYTGDGQPPLIRAILASEQRMVALLIQRGADTNQPVAEWRGESSAETTPMTIALRKLRQQQHQTLVQASF